MAPILVRLLVLLSLPALMGFAPAVIGLVRLPADPGADAPPAPLDWRALASEPSPPRPPVQGRRLALRSASTLPEFGHFSAAEFLAELARRQGRTTAEALVLLRGSFALADLAEEAPDPAVLERQGDVFTLRRPLVIRRGAALVMAEGSALRLETARGAFLVNGGQLVLRDARITSWDAARHDASGLERDRQFRPFVAAIAGSWTEIVNGTLSHLGYDAAKSYGLSLVSGPSSLASAGPPRGRITGSRIVGNYYGLYSYEAHGLVITDNAFVDNLVYGLDPHDRSRGLVIAGNTAIGTERRHGIIVSRGVSDSWIVDNRAIGNGGTGIVIDAGSTGNVVARNLAGANRGDGLSLFESAHNLLWGNLAIGNAKSGLRVRNGWAIEVRRNRFVGNGYDGIEAYAEELGPGLENAWRLPWERRLEMSLDDNLMLGNRRSALNLRNLGQIDLTTGRRGAWSLRLGGDLRDCADEIRKRIAAWGAVRILGRGNPSGAGGTLCTTSR